VIRLRDLLERGLAHPLLGPLLLLVLVLLLSMVFLHVAHEGMEAATALGELCLGIVTALGLVLAARVSLVRAQEAGTSPRDRGPPRARVAPPGRERPDTTALLRIPLRR